MVSKDDDALQTRACKNWLNNIEKDGNSKEIREFGNGRIHLLTAGEHTRKLVAKHEAYNS